MSRPNQDTDKRVMQRMIMREARMHQKIYASHDCTSTEVVDRAYNDKLTCLADLIEEFHAKLEAAENEGVNARRTSQFHKDNHLAAETIIQAVRDWFESPHVDRDDLYEIIKEADDAF